MAFQILGFIRRIDGNERKPFTQDDARIREVAQRPERIEYHGGSLRIPRPAHQAIEVRVDSGGFLILAA